MHPIHDVDALLLFAIGLASKRRPAEPLEIVAAIDLIQGNIPAEAKLSEAIARLAVHGLIGEVDGRCLLTADAQKMIEALPRKAEPDAQLFALRGALAAYTPPGECAAIEIAPETLRSAMLAHRANAESGAKNLLVAKPKPVEPTTRPGQRQRKPLPARRRKD